MTILTGLEMCRKLAEVFKLDLQSNIGSISISARCGEVAVVNIERAITEEEASAIEEIARRYILVDEERLVGDGDVNGDR